MACNLSKTRYCSAVQCPKMLWLQEHKPECFDDSVVNSGAMENGTRVGILARGLFGNYTLIPYGDLKEMVRQTALEIENGTPVIAEASFLAEGLFCSVDILRVVGEKRVELYEVKSSTEVKDIYYHDVAYQCYVLRRCGYTVEKTCLVHINNQYVRHGELDMQELFHIADLTEAAAAMQGEVEKKIADTGSYMEQTCEPDDDIGAHCFAPYDCGFFTHCTEHLPRPNIFDVARVQDRKALDCYKKGVVSFSELLVNKVFSPKSAQYKQIRHEIEDCKAEIDTAEIRSFMQTLRYPLYFLDFESFQSAVPLYDDSKPYEQIVFQYSLHVIEEEGGELQHREFLAYPGKDPRRALAEQLCRDIPVNVCTTAYNMGFEKGRIRGLAELYPDLAEHLMNIHDNIVDLMVPFQKKWYYCRAMQGSYSIKYVLPALFPDDPKLDYHNLEGVHNGVEASATFITMSEMTQEELEESRKNLLKYCELDTYAMVKIWEKLREV